MDLRNVLGVLVISSLSLLLLTTVSGTLSWSNVSHSPNIYDYGVAVTGAGDNIYILNSSQQPWGSGEVYCKFWRYNTEDNSWDSLPVPQYSGGLTVWAKNGSCMTWDNGNYIYAMFGASYGDGPSDGDSRYFFYRYNISSDTWTRLTDTPHFQGPGDAITWVPGSAVGTSSDWIYAIIGAKDPSVQSDCEGTYFSRYNINSYSWEDLTYNPSWSGEGSDDGSSLVWAGGDYLYALQGEWKEGDGNKNNGFARYDLTDGNWQDLSDIPEDDAWTQDDGVGDGGSLVWAGERYPDNIFAFGGGTAYENPDDDFYSYSISEQTWTQLSGLPKGITDQNGSRLGYASENIYCWRGYYNATQDPDVLWSYPVPEAENVREVSLSVTPFENNALPGENTVFTVTVNNTGNISDSYNLEALDDKGWQISLSQTSVSLPPESSTDVTLKVGIPQGIAGGTEDNLEITATSENDDNVSNGDNCIASAATVRTLDVTISPNEENGIPGSTLEYEVRVFNTGNVSDDYALDNSDNRNWGLEIDNTLFENVSPGDNRLTTLRVTIPEGENAGVEDNITVTATSQENSLVQGSASFKALSVDLDRSFKVDVSPAQGSGTPGTVLEYTVRVRNEGNVIDNYELTVDEDAGWAFALADNLLENIHPDESKSTLLNVSILDNDNLVGISDNILVTAVSQGENELSDNFSCLAYSGNENTSQIHFGPGWNLIGFSLTDENMSKDNLFTNPGSVTMLTGVPLGVVGSDELLSDNLGYYVNTPESETVLASGVPLPICDIRLNAGWNLVSFPVVNSGTTKENLFQGTGVSPGSVTMLTGVPLGVVGSDELLSDNLGYYVNTPEPVTVTCP